MTVASTPTVAGPFTGTGASATLPFAFKCFATSDLIVESNGTTLNYGGDYTVTLNGDQEGSPGGTVTVSSAANALGALVYIGLNMALSQPSRFPSQSAWSPTVVEKAFDRLTLLIKQLTGLGYSAVVAPLGETLGILPAKVARVGKYFAFDANGDPLMSSGTGNDSALRTDLAATTGATLVNFTRSETGAVARTVQAKLRDTASVLDFGADPTGVADSSAAFTNAAAGSGLIVVPKGSYLLNSAPSLGAAVFRYDKGVTLSGAGASGTWAVSGTASTQYVQTTPASTDLATEFIRREASYSGGTIGFDTVALRVQTDVSANVVNYEWNGLFQLNNSATAGQNAALYAQANKMATGPTWAFVSQVNDSTGGDTGGCVGHEIDVLANGTDPANNRVAIDIVGGRYGGTGALAEIGYGIRISPQNFDTTNAKFKCGFQGNGLFVTGIDFTGAIISGNVFQSPGFSVDGAGNVRSTASVGYGTGAGGAVTQLTSKATSVTLNKVCGAITLNNAALAATTIVSFTLTNTTIAADDDVRVWVKSGNASVGSYRVAAEGNAAGSRTIVVENKTAGSLSEAIVLGFNVLKAVVA